MMGLEWVHYSGPVVPEKMRMTLIGRCFYCLPV